MKLLHYMCFIIKIHKVESYFIKNQNKPICANCKYFIPNKNECSNFGEIDIITNKHTYEDAIIVRNDDDKCGEDAVFFKKNYFKFITIPYYSIIENIDTINLFLSPLVTAFFLTYFLCYCALHLFK